MYENNQLQSSDERQSTKTSLYTLAKILNINNEDIEAIKRRRKMLMILGILLAIISFLAGCISPPGPVHYMGIGTLDFSWTSRFLRL